VRRSARYLADAGLNAHRSGDFLEAERLYRESLAASPDDPDVLHMLGVALMQQFDYPQARHFIERAGALIDWRAGDFRHNRAHLLSVYLSGRAAPSIPQLIATLHNQRAQRAARKLESVAVIVVADVANPAVDAARVSDMVGVETGGGTRVYLAQQVVANGEFVALSTALRGAIELALRDSVDAVVIVPIGTTFATSALTISEKFWAAGADWGIYGPTNLSDSVVDAAAQKLHRAKLLKLRDAVRVGAALLDDHTLHSFLSVTAFRTEFLRPSIASLSLESVHGLAFSALRLSEPIFLGDQMISLAGSTIGSWWQPHVGVFDDYINWALDTDCPENLLAPAKSLDGLGFLKRPLRVWIGRYLTPQTLSKITRLIDTRTPHLPQRSDGVEYIGFARAESGLGESLRLLVRATTTVDIPCAVGDLALDVGMRQADSAVSELIVSKPEFRTRVVCVNPDSLGEALALDGYSAVGNTYEIGYWYWELERIPQLWAASSRLFREIWVASKFVADAVTSMTDVPVRIITPPLLAPIVGRSFARPEFGMDNHAYVFLFSFAYGSFATRKNPEAVIRAFREAFPRSLDGVRLVIKTSQSELFPDHVASLASEVNGDPRISFINATLSREQVTGLQMAADCYVSLHRSEGLGLGMAESMALGKPTIGTGYSGNLAFMNESNSLLVDYKLVAIRPGEYIDADGQHWADASVEDAARKMRFLYENASEGRRLGERARTYLASQFSLASVGGRIRDALRDNLR
jgi:glycosyltransferase involved in cell wall biosynthesis